MIRDDPRAGLVGRRGGSATPADRGTKMALVGHDLAGRPRRSLELHASSGTARPGTARAGLPTSGTRMADGGRFFHGLGLGGVLAPLGSGYVVLYLLVCLRFSKPLMHLVPKWSGFAPEPSAAAGDKTIEKKNKSGYYGRLPAPQRRGEWSNDSPKCRIPPLSPAAARTGAEAGGVRREVSITMARTGWSSSVGSTPTPSIRPRHGSGPIRVRQTPSPRATSGTSPIGARDGPPASCKRRTAIQQLLNKFLPAAEPARRRGDEGRASSACSTTALDPGLHECRRKPDSCDDCRWS
jgi:hypothetical protein